MPDLATAAHHDAPLAAAAEPMEGHVKTVAWLQAAFGLLSAFTAAYLLWAFAGFLDAMQRAGFADDAVPLRLFVQAFAIVSLAAGVLGVAGAAGLLLRRRWGRLPSLVACALGLPAFPLGTGLGAYGLWVLTRPETLRLLRPRLAP